MWTRLETARSIGEATLLRDALAQEGLTVELRGEHRPAIAGELPLSEAQVEVWVRTEDAARARALLLERHRMATLPDRPCPHCTEPNPPSFELCWRCERPLDDAAGTTAPVPEPERPVKDPGPSPERASVGPWLLALLVVAGVSFAGGRWSLGTSSAPESKVFQQRWDSAGECLEQSWRGTGGLAAQSCDHDHDGEPEWSAQYDRSGALVAKSFDEDENGIFERVVGYAGPAPVSENLDRDQDGHYEHVRSFAPDGRVVSDLYDDDRDGRHERMAEHWPDEVEVLWRDQDGDGLFERREVSRAGRLLRVEHGSGVDRPDAGAPAP